jgi:putative lysine transport system substrate-binding protein
MVYTMKRIFALILAVALMLCALTSCSKVSGPKDLDNVKDAGQIVVGMECAYAPYNWTTSTPSATTVPIANSEGSYADGYDVQIAKLIAQELGVELVIKAIEWDGLIPALEAGEIDMIIAGMSPTEERKLSISFSNTYFDSNLVMVVRKDGSYTTADDIQDFSGAKITGQLNTFHYAVIDQINGVQKQTALSDFAALTQSLSSGAIDGYVCEKPGAVSAVASNDEFTYIEFTGSNGFTCDPAESSISVGLRQESSLTETINAVIARLSTAEKEAMMDAAIERQPAAE